jgi:hypothetical protein
MNLRLPSFVAAIFASCALALAASACSGASNGIGNGNGNDGGMGMGTCVTTGCGSNGQTYQVCTTQPSGGCANITYSVGSQSWSCSSCGNPGCSSAAESAVQACLGSSGDGGTGDSSVTGHQTCSSQMQCGTNGRTYQECTTTSESGACISIDYKTSDGKAFTCPGCQNCSSAATELQNYCSMTTTSSCSTPTNCGTTGFTYEECTTTSGGACESISYNVSNGSSFTCASCSDCTAAMQQLDNVCAGGGSVSCTTMAQCETSQLTYQQCTVSQNGTCQSVYYETSDDMKFTCASCGDCSAALTGMENYCLDSGMSMTSCGASSPCGSTGVTYDLCTTTTGGSCTGEYYSTSDGQTYTCNGCDCTTASQQLSSYCASLTGTTCGATTCTSGDLCCNCSGTDECLTNTNPSLGCAAYQCVNGP